MFGIGLTGFLATLVSLAAWGFIGPTRTPWLLLGVQVVACALMVGSLFRRHTVWRIATAAAGTLIAAGAWYVLLIMLAFPPYEGELEAGSHVPPFESQTLAGTAFDQGALAKGQPTLLVFYRGSW